jgi:hypothetical protein
MFNSVKFDQNYGTEGQDGLSDLFRKAAFKVSTWKSFNIC